MSVDRRVANLEGDTGLPRKNGELVFDAPWEGRAFGLAVVLNEKGAYTWDDFRSRLVDQVRTGEPHYYENWIRALESLLAAQEIVSPEEVELCAAEYRALKRDPVF
ncbi:MAG TPA: nitrile hydratase accessory protein [Candidatus Dormibacteraeota bacterium]|nr:nitrile hydratase accessory protein [Candidatus Dormibacteraeota bacterium]